HELVHRCQELLLLRRADAALEAFDEGEVVRVGRSDVAEEAGERLAGIGLLERRLHALGQLADTLIQHGGRERVLGREAAEDRAVPHAGPPCDLVDADVEPLLREALCRRVERAAAVPSTVGKQRDAEKGSSATSAAMVATEP